MEKRLKIGIIGTGGISHLHMKGYNSMPDLCEIVAFCDVNPESAAKARDTYTSSGRTTCDYREVINDPEIDAVSVATPNAYHKQPTVEALRAGKHVLCEKPLGMNAAECKEMCAAARESGKILQVALQNRFTSAGRFMKTYVDSGAMGEIYYARAQALRRRGVPGWGVFIDKEKQGGGPLIDIGVHILDFTLYLMGYPKPVSATGKTWDVLGKNPEIWNGMGDYDRSKFTVEDFAVGMIKFENGAVVTLESSFMANLDGNPFQTDLFGTKAGASVKVYEQNGIKIFTEQNQQLFDMTPVNLPSVDSSHVDEVKAFVQAIKNGDPSPVPGEQGLILNAIFDAIYKSSETGKEQSVDVSY
jgi:predicted dehydrogenase